MGVIDFYQRARFKYLPKVLARTLDIDRRTDLSRVGSAYGGWSIPSTLINADSIVYCVGCGEDISFDVGLIERFGCHVWAFDPTPRAIAHVESVLNAKPAVREKYHFRPAGLWSTDTKTTFYLPDDTLRVSGSLVGLAGTKHPIEVDVRRLSTLMADNRHSRIDLLKIDVEGAEYDVLADVLSEAIRPKWIGIDFDQPVPFRKTHAMIRALRSNGYRLVNVDHWDYGFVHASAVAGG